MKEREGKPGMRFQNSLINFQFSIKNSLRNRPGFQSFSFFERERLIGHQQMGSYERTNQLRSHAQRKNEALILFLY